MNIQNITFQSPQFIYAVFFIFLFIVLFYRLFSYRKEIFVKYASPSCRNLLLIPRNELIYWIKLIGLCVAWGLTIFALMQPISYGEYPQEVREKGYEKGTSGYQRPAHAVILLIDNSASMSVNSKSGDLLATAKEIADLTISQLEGQQLSLISFASEPTILSPLTFDYLFVRLMLQQLQINEEGDAGTNLLNLFNFLGKEVVSNIPTSILLFTDGGDTGLEFTTEETRKKQEEAILNSLKNVKNEHLRVYSIGLGSRAGVPIPEVVYNGKPVVSKVNESLLKKIAEIGNGKYFYSEEFTSIDLADQLAHILNTSEKKTDITKMQEAPLFHFYYFQVPLAGAILLLLCVVFLPNSHKKILTILAFSSIFSGDLQADIHHEMLEAKSYADVKSYQQSLELYNGILDQHLMPWQRAIVLYNIGTVHLFNKQFDEAIDILQNVPIKDHPLPLLKSYVSTNLILAYFGKAESLKKRPSLAIKSLKNAMKQIPEARRAQCSLQIAEGYNECQDPKELLFLEDFITEKTAVLLEQEKIDILLHSSFEEGIKELIKLIDESERDLLFLENKNLSESQREKYQNLFLSEIQSWIPIWISLKRKIRVEDPNSNKKMKLFNASASHFLQALSQMEQRNDVKSKNQFEKSKKYLEELLKLPPMGRESTEETTPEKSQKSPKEEAKEERAEDKADIEDVTHLLIEMNQLDTMKKKESHKRKGDSKPW